MKRPLFTIMACALLLSCERKAELTACNIAQRSCQEDIYYEVMRLRGDGFDPFQGVPPIRTITLKAYRKELMAEQAPATSTSASAPKGPPEIDPWEVALHLLGLVNPAMSTQEASINNNVNNVAAFFSSASGGVTVIDRGDMHDDSADTALLAHELVHAFQAREQGAAAGTSTTDGSFTGEAQIEGEAVLYEHLVGAELQGIAPQRVDWDRYYRGWANGLRGMLPQQDSPFYAVSWFIYPFGGDLLTRAWLTGGNSAVRKLGTDFPRRSLDYMASLVNAKAGSAPPIACEITPPADSWKLAGYDRFGAMQLYAFLNAAGLAESEAWSRGLRWRDDLIWLYYDKPSQKVALSWRIRLADRASADAVVAAVADKPMLHTLRDGDDVLIVGSDDEDQLANWKGAAKCQ